LYCCNTQVEVGTLADDDFASLWYGPRWQQLREKLRAGHYLVGCDKCGKFEQNVKWSERFRDDAGDDAWRAAVGLVADDGPTMPRTPTRLRVVE
jgi:hypothetical protein